MVVGEGLGYGTTRDDTKGRQLVNETVVDEGVRWQWSDASNTLRLDSYLSLESSCDASSHEMATLTALVSSDLLLVD
jgi:hypothetical protein